MNFHCDCQVGLTGTACTRRLSHYLPRLLGKRRLAYPSGIQEVQDDLGTCCTQDAFEALAATLQATPEWLVEALHRSLRSWLLG